MSDVNALAQIFARLRISQVSVAPQIPGLPEVEMSIATMSDVDALAQILSRLQISQAVVTPQIPGLPVIETVAPTLSGVIRDSGIADQVLQYLLDEDVVYEVRPAYVEHQSSFGRPPPSSQRAIIPSQLARVGQLATAVLHVVSTQGQTPNGIVRFPPPFAVFVEHNVSSMEAMIKALDPILASAPTVRSNFLQLRLTSREIYHRSWDFIIRNGLTLQIIGSGIPYLQQLRHRPAVVLRNPRSYDITSNLRTLVLAPSFEHSQDYSSMIRQMPRLETITLGSMHIEFRSISRDFESYGLMCGLQIGDPAAMMVMVCLAERLVNPRIAVDGNQRITVLRQVSFSVECERYNLVLNVMAGHLVPMRGVSTIEIFIYHAMLEFRRATPWIRTSYPSSILRTYADQHISRTNGRCMISPNISTQYGRGTDIFIAPTIHEARRYWHDFATTRSIRMVPPSTILRYATSLIADIEAVRYVFQA